MIISPICTIKYIVGEMQLKEQLANRNKEDIINKGKSNQNDIVFLKKAIYSMRDKKLLKIINQIFRNIEPNTMFLGEIKFIIRMRKKISNEEHKEIFECLVDLENDTKEYGIARMKKIEAENDTKTIPYLLTIIFFMLPYYEAILDFKGLGTWLMLGFSAFILVLITWFIVGAKAKVQTAIYFRSLLESAKEIKKEQETYTKEQLVKQIEQVKKQQEYVENKQERIEQRLFLLKENNK